MVDEIWKDIKGYEGVYQVSNLGRVKSLKRNGTVNYDKLLKQPHDSNGYCIIVLSKDNVPKSIKVHRLVAKTFIPNPNNLPEVNHKDEDKTNNCVDNLEWCSHKYNINYGNRTKLVSMKRSKPISMYNIEGKLIKTFDNGVVAEKETGISRYHINSCCRHKYGRKTAGGYIWEYVEEVL